MTRRVVRAAGAVALLAAAAPLGGCAISLFSTEKQAGNDPARLSALESRMDVVEQRLPQASTQSP